MITMDCSRSLNNRVQLSFEVPENISEDCYRYISFNWLGNCHMLEKGLCLLHQEKGEEFLPKVCKLYPRSLKSINGVNLASCSSSCEKVIELLFDKDSLTIQEIDLEDVPEIIYEVDYDDVLQIRQFQELIKDRSTTLAQSIIDICKIINLNEFQKDYYEDINPLMSCINLLNKFYGSNYQLDEIINNINDRYLNNSYLFEKDKELFEDKYPEWMYIFERIINNSMLYENYPFVDKRIDKTDVYKGLCCTYGLLRLVCINACAINDEREYLIDCIACLFHLIEHTAFYYNASILANNAAIMLRV